jgi:hypothetical protein
MSGKNLPMVVPFDVCDVCRRQEECMERDCYLSQYALCITYGEPSFLSAAAVEEVALAEIAAINARSIE